MKTKRITVNDPDNPEQLIEVDVEVINYDSKKDRAELRKRLPVVDDGSTDICVDCQHPRSRHWNGKPGTASHEDCEHDPQCRCRGFRTVPRVTMPHEAVGPLRVPNEAESTIEGPAQIEK